MKQKCEKSGFLSIFLGALGASLLENLLTSKDTIQAGEEKIRSSQKFWCCVIVLLIFKYKKLSK